MSNKKNHIEIYSKDGCYHSYDLSEEIINLLIKVLNSIKYQTDAKATIEKIYVKFEVSDVKEVEDGI